MRERIVPLKLLLFDVDGVLTDGGMIYGTGDVEIKRFDVHDGFGLTMAKAAGLRVGIMTGRRSEAVTRRAEQLGIDCVWQGYFDKRVAYEELKRAEGLADREIAYMGDDILDLRVLQLVGFAIAPANARAEVREHVHYVTEAAGGHGAVRECVEYILRTLGRLDEINDHFANGEVPARNSG